MATERRAFFGATLGIIILLVSVLVTACSTHREINQVHWQTASNACFATYQHVWSDITFQSDTALALVDILRPVAAIALREDKPEEVRKVQLPQQRENASAPTMLATQTMAKVESTEQRPGFQTEKRTSEARDSSSPAKQEASEKKATATIVEKAGASRDARSDPSTAVRDARPAELAKDNSGLQRASDTAGSIGTTAKATASRESAQSADARSVENAPTQVVASQQAGQKEIASISELRARGDTASTVANKFAGTVDVRNMNAKTSNNQFASRVQTAALLPSLTVQKSCDSPSVLAGNTVRFRIQVKNTGTLELRNIVLHDTASGALQFVRLGEVTGGSVSRARNDQFNIAGTLKPDATIRFATTYRVPRPEP